MPEVEDETAVQGKARGYADAQRIELAIRTGKLVVVAPTATEKRLATSIYDVLESQESLRDPPWERIPKDEEDIDEEEDQIV